MKCSFRRFIAGVIACGAVVVALHGSPKSACYARNPNHEVGQTSESGRIVPRIAPRLSQAVVNAGSWAPLIHDWPQDTCSHERRYAEARAVNANSTTPKSVPASRRSELSPSRSKSVTPLRSVPRSRTPQQQAPVWFWDGPLASGANGPFRADLHRASQPKLARNGWFANLLPNHPPMRRELAKTLPAPPHRSFSASDFRVYVDPICEVESTWRSLGEQYLAQNQRDEAKSNKPVRERNIVRDLYEIAKVELATIRENRISIDAPWARVQQYLAKLTEISAQTSSSQPTATDVLEITSSALQPLADWARFHRNTMTQQVSWDSCETWAYQMDRQLEMNLCGTRFLEEYYELKSAWRQAAFDAQVAEANDFVSSEQALNWTADWLDQVSGRLQSASLYLRRTAAEQSRRQASRVTGRTSR